MIRAPKSTFSVLNPSGNKKWICTNILFTVGDSIAKKKEAASL